MAERYNFKYLPLVGKLPGKSMVEQTETAINELASVVYDNVGYVGNLAEEVQTANTNASNALDKATEALETSGRVYIKLIAAVDVNDYYDSELYYINNDGSTNIPVRDRGFLEVKTNDDKTACEQVFIADSTGTPYYRHGVITEQTLGEETTYVVTWGSWYQGATTEYVNAYTDDRIAALPNTFLPLTGGTMTGNIKFTIIDSIARSVDNSYLTIFGGSTYRKGAYMALSGKDRSGSSGNFDLTADDGTTTKKLVGKPDGTLTWGDVSLTDGTFLTTRNVTTGLKPASGSSITAPAVSGYQFVCWVASASNNAVLTSYIIPATSQTANLWYIGTASNNVTFTCTALYVRKW